MVGNTSGAYVPISISLSEVGHSNAMLSIPGAFSIHERTKADGCRRLPRRRAGWTLQIRPPHERGIGCGGTMRGPVRGRHGDIGP